MTLIKTDKRVPVSERLGTAGGKHPILERVRCWWPFLFPGVPGVIRQRHEAVLFTGAHPEGVQVTGIRGVRESHYCW